MLIQFKCNNSKKLLNSYYVSGTVLMGVIALFNFSNSPASNLYQVHYTGNEAEGKWYNFSLYFFLIWYIMTKMINLMCEFG